MTTTRPSRESRASARHGYAELEDVRLHYAEAGEGPLVVLLHGFPDFWYSWRHQLPALAEAGFHAVAPDMRGYNLSDQPRSVAAYDLGRLTRDVLQLADHFGSDRIHLVGHDWGAIVAWFFAMDHPGALDRLVVANVPHPARFIDMARSPRQVLRSWYVGFFQVPFLPEMAVRAGGFAPLRRVLRTEPHQPGTFDDADIDAYVEAAGNSGMRGPINYYRALARRNPLALRNDRRVIENETLVLWGERDRVLGPELAEPPEELVPRCRVLRFPDAAHWVHIEKPAEVNAELVGFLGAG